MQAMRDDFCGIHKMFHVKHDQLAGNTVFGKLKMQTYIIVFHVKHCVVVISECGW